MNNNNKKKTQQIEGKKASALKEGPKNMVGYLLQLFETYRKLLELEINNSISSTVAAVVVVVTFLVFGSFILLFISIGAALFFNRLIGISSINHNGFFIVAGIYLVTFLILLRSKGFVKRVIFNKIQNLISKLTKR